MRFTLDAKVTISTTTIVEAATLEEAIAIANMRGVVFADNSEDSNESWVCDEPDGTVFDITQQGAGMCAPTNPIRNEDGSLHQSTLKVGGQRFRCACGCNVFHQPDDRRPETYQCNSCDARFTSEPA